MADHEYSTPDYSVAINYAIAAVTLENICSEGYKLDKDISLQDFNLFFERFNNIPIPAELYTLRDAVWTHLTWIRECTFSKKGRDVAIPSVSRDVSSRKTPSLITPRKHKANIKSYVYVVQHENTSKMKIGHTKNLEVRLRGLQLASPVKLTIRYAWEVEDSYLVEQALHAYFSPKRLRGEWFELSKEDEAELLAYMKDYFLAAGAPSA